MHLTELNSVCKITAKWVLECEAITMTTCVSSTSVLLHDLSSAKQAFKLSSSTQETQRHHKNPHACFRLEQEQKWPRPSENTVVGKVKWRWNSCAWCSEGRRRARCLLEDAEQRALGPIHTHILPPLIQEQD